MFLTLLSLSISPLFLSFSQGGWNIASRFTFRAYFRKTVPYFVFRFETVVQILPSYLSSTPYPFFILYSSTECQPRAPTFSALWFRFPIDLPIWFGAESFGPDICDVSARERRAWRRSALIVRGNNNKENKACPVIKPRRLP